jgi:exodeoxyribonuclease VII small subunit
MASRNSARKADGSEPPEPTFEEALAELEGVVAALEAGDMPLERALELFEKGVGLSDSCRRRLEEAETKVEILLKKGRKLEAEPFEVEDDGGDA